MGGRKLTILLILLLCRLGCVLGGEPKRFEFQQVQMGTLFRIVIYSADPESAQDASRAAFRRIEQLEGIFSDYREDSELNSACRTAVHRGVVVSRDLYCVMEKSLYFSRLTKGAFDITLKPLADLWKAGRKDRRLPAVEEIEKLRTRVGYRYLLLNSRLRSLKLNREDIRIDLGGIAKGYTADEVLVLLEDRGISSVLVDAGGDLRMGDPPPGKPGWMIEDAESAAGSGSCWILRNCAVATSGDRYQFIEIGGIRYSHIVDPATGFGVVGPRSATVIAPDATTADALATAFCVLSVEEIIEITGKIPAVSARIIRGNPAADSESRFLVRTTCGFPDPARPGIQP